MFGVWGRWVKVIKKCLQYLLQAFFVVKEFM